MPFYIFSGCYCYMHEKLASLAKEIRANSNYLQSKANEIRASQFVVPVSKIPLTLSVCAVDGGLLAQRMHGADILVCRALSVTFTYENSTFKSFSYHPSKIVEPELEIKNSLDEHEAVVFRSLFRLKRELETALSSLSHSPSFLLLDGSLLPLPSDRPPDGSELGSLYAEVVLLYTSLYSSAAEKNCVLCGVVKDSRSRKLSKEFKLNCSDSMLCSHLLNGGERTPIFSAQEKDLGKKIKFFYLQSSSYDLPLRIEFLDSDEDKIDKIASVIYTLSAISENFAYPAVLVEADMCAALNPEDLDSIISSLTRLSGLRPLRRNSRPFR